MECNRRDFFKKTLAGLASLGMAGTAKAVFSGQQNESMKPIMKNGIRYRKLGKTGVDIPVVSMGVMNARDPALVRKAYESGIRHFDTAFSYGNGRNEEMIGSVIQELHARDQVFIATKVMTPWVRKGLSHDQARTKCIRMVEDSLGFLKMDCVDIVYLHDVSTKEDVTHEGFQEAIVKLKKDGKVRFTGFSTHQNMSVCINEALQHPFYDVILTTYNYSLADDKPLFESLKNAAAAGIGLIAMKTQCNQFWYKNMLPSEMQKYYDGNIINSAILKWVLGHPFITTAVPGVTTFQQIDEDTAVAQNLDYTPAEIRFLEERNIRFSVGVCKQCRACTVSCPKHVEIPTLVRAHMYAMCYPNLEQAKIVMANMPSKKGLQSCFSCSTCSATCPSSINLKKRIDELKAFVAKAGHSIYG